MTPTQILNEFISKIEQIGKEKGIRYEPRFGRRRIKNIFNLLDTIRCTISIHVSTGKKPFWGIMKNTINEFQQSKMNWGIVLLENSSTSGYFLSSDDVIQSMKD